jgi:polysaccharide export outer membrane protein
MRSKHLLITTILVSIVFTWSCTINSHHMLKTSKDFPFDTIPTTQNLEYTIAPGDLLQFRLYSNAGYMLIDISSGNGGNNNLLMRTNAITYLVRQDSMVKLPILGDINMVGKKIKDAELYLEKLYSEFYVEPYLNLEVTNKRIIVFPGTGNNAQVVTLANNSTTIVEALARVGGISVNSYANNIKVVRETDSGTKVFRIDLSTIEGYQEGGNFIVQSNDIIYVTPTPSIAREALQDIAPVISIITSTVLVWTTLRRLSN